jgi:hypothetical protein
MVFSNKGLQNLSLDLARSLGFGGFEKSCNFLGRSDLKIIKINLEKNSDSRQE